MTPTPEMIEAAATELCVRRGIKPCEMLGTTNIPKWKMFMGEAEAAIKAALSIFEDRT